MSQEPDILDIKILCSLSESGGDDMPLVHKYLDLPISVQTLRKRLISLRERGLARSFTENEDVGGTLFWKKTPAGTEAIAAWNRKEKEDEEVD